MNDFLSGQIDNQEHDSATGARKVEFATESITLLNAATVTGAGADVPVGTFKTMTIEVFGTASSFTVQIQGKSTSGTAYTLGMTNLGTLGSASSITSAGLYQCDVTGLVSVDANITAVTGGNVTAQGKLVTS